MRRRFEKKVYDGGVLTKHLRFVYDGCKLIAIHDALNGDRQVMTFVWQPEGAGLDVPLAMTWNEAAYFYICDGNKNVIAMTDSSGTRVAEYIYAPFGRILHLEGELAEINPFRFSSEYHDDETSLVYYNYRYYNPTLGRWTKRDPIGEKGGVNIYAVNGNDLISYWDFIGTVKLNIKLINICLIRFLRAHYSIIGAIYNWSFDSGYDFYDEEKELIETLEDSIQKQMIKAAKQQGVKGQWQQISLSRTNIGPLSMDSTGLGSTGYLLNAASNIYIKGTFYARLCADQFQFREIAIDYEWHDNLDANSFFETFQKFYSKFPLWEGIKYHATDIAHLLENSEDLFIEKTLAPDFSFVIYGCYCRYEHILYL